MIVCMKISNLLIVSTIMPIFRINPIASMGVSNNKNTPVNTFSNAIKSIRNVDVDKKGGVILVLGKKNISRDNIHLLGQQIPRIIRGKSPYPMLFLNEEAKNEFKQSIDSLRKASDSIKGKSTDAIVGRALISAAKNQTDFSMANVQLELYRKIYITGHGSAGISHIYSGDSKFTVLEIVDLLENHGILDKIKDVRITCCNSADKREVKDLSQESVELANRSSSFIENLFYGEQKSLIEKLSSEIWDRGYTDVRISGYHGKGVFYNSKDIPLSHLRSSTIPATDTVKRKSLRVTLESDLD
ncbi:OspB protein [Vibrio parahaemolyticus]|nr:OspB protein [Vibrio parahaemolyticus]EID0733754.1 OspB protein [Vibrio parahaemolyticus]ELA9417363.1 OspB protein [Vibrio parahaemolyticus]